MADGYIVRKGGGGAEPIPFDTGPGPQELKAGDYNAGFFGLCTQEDFFGNTTDNMATPIMSSLGISQGTAQFTTDPLLKFIHKGKIKYINQRTIRHSISWNHIQERLSGATLSNTLARGNVYAGAILTINGRKYRVRLMRGWGQVSANTNGTGAPNYNSGPLNTISIAYGTGGNNGVNWPTNTSPWNAASPNEWNTLIFPIHADSGIQTQTADTPNWASYTNTDLQIQSGNGTGTWVQETNNNITSLRIARGLDSLAQINYNFSSGATQTFTGLRLVFELI